MGDVALEQPSGIVADKAGRMYLVDTALANVFVFEEGEFARSLIKAGAHTLTSPTVISISEDGRTLYVADPPRNIIAALNREGDVDERIALTEATRDPGSISVIDNQIYVLGTRQHRLEFFTPAGRLRGELKWDGIQFPLAFAFQESTHRFLVANPRLMAVEIRDEESHGIGAFGKFGDALDESRRISGIHVDWRGFVYLVDSHHGKVLMFGENDASVP